MSYELDLAVEDPRPVLIEDGAGFAVDDHADGSVVRIRFASPAVMHDVLLSLLSQYAARELHHEDRPRLPLEVK